MDGISAPKDLEWPSVGLESCDERSAFGRPLIDREAIGVAEMLPKQSRDATAIDRAADDIGIAAGSSNSKRESANSMWVERRQNLE